MAISLPETPDLTGTAAGLAAVACSSLPTPSSFRRSSRSLRKSKPVVVAAGVVWVLVAMAWSMQGLKGAAEAAANNAMEYGELLLFLLAAMTYVNTLEERDVFAALRSWLVARGAVIAVRCSGSPGLMAFFLSPVLDNLTTALVMGAVALAIGRGKPRVHRTRLHQHRGGGQCRRCVQSFRRHHHTDGVAEGRRQRSSNSSACSCRHW